MNEKPIVDPARDLTFEEEQALFEKHARGEGFTDFTTTHGAAYKDERLQLYWCGFFHGIRKRQDWSRKHASGALPRTARAKQLTRLAQLASRYLADGNFPAYREAAAALEGALKEDGR